MKVVLNQCKLWLFSCLVLLAGCGGSDNTPVLSVQADASIISFSNELLVANSQSKTISLNFQGDGLLVGFAPNAEIPPWLAITTNELNSTNAKVTVNIINGDKLIPNLYQTTLRFTVTDQAGSANKFVDIPVSLRVWQLTPDTNLVSFAQVLGGENPAPQSVTITSVDNNWQASVDVPWLSLDKSEAVGTDTISITPDISTLTESGLYQANLTLTEATTGDTKQIPIELGLDKHYLYADQASIAFTKTDNLSLLSKTITLTSNSPTAITWQANSLDNWLILTPDVANNQLVIAVDTNNLPADNQSQAQVAISADGVESETILVSLYQQTGTSDNQITADITINNNSLIANPLTPTSYVAVGNELRAYQQYTGALLQSLMVSPENTVLEQLVISPKGDILLAQANETTTDENGEETTTTHRYQIDLANWQASELTDSDIEFNPLAFVRIQGRYFVVTQALEFADSSLKRLAWDQSNAFFVRTLRQAKKTGDLWALDANTNSFKQLNVTANDFVTTPITSTLANEYKPETLADGEQIRDFYVSATASDIYLNSPNSQHIQFDGETFTDLGLIETNTDLILLNQVQDHLGQMHWLYFDPSQGFTARQYDAQNQLTSDLLLGFNQPFQSSISSDGLRIIFASDNSQTLNFSNALTP